MEKVELLETKIQKLLERLKKKTVSIQEHCKELSVMTFLSSGTLSDLERLEADILEITKIKNQLLDVFPFREENLYSPDMKEYVQEIRGWFNKEENELFFELADGLPHRMTYDASSGKMRHVYNRAIVEKMYMDAIQEVKKEYTLTLWPGSALISVYIYYTDENEDMLPDADNIDTKPFIDALIRCRVLLDDNLSHVGCYITGIKCKKGEKEQTVIKVKLY